MYLSKETHPNNNTIRVFFLPPSDAYVRSFLYLLYTLIKLYYTHTHTHTEESSECFNFFILHFTTWMFYVLTFETNTQTMTFTKKLCTISSMCLCSVTSVVSDSLRPHELQPTRLLCPWDSPCKNTGADCHFLLCKQYALQSFGL